MTAPKRYTKGHAKIGEIDRKVKLELIPRAYDLTAKLDSRDDYADRWQLIFDDDELESLKVEIADLLIEQYRIGLLIKEGKGDEVEVDD